MNGFLSGRVKILLIAPGAALAAFSLSAAELAHRWSFNGDWSDSVAGADATGVGERVSLYGNRVHIGGYSASDTGYVVLGTNRLDTAEATMEIWARHDGVRNWSRVFDYGTDTAHYFQMPWTYGTILGRDSVGAKNGGAETSVANTMAPYELGTDYHIAVTFQRSGEATVVRWQRRVPLACRRMGGKGPRLRDTYPIVSPIQHTIGSGWVGSHRVERAGAPVIK